MNILCWLLGHQWELIPKERRIWHRIAACRRCGCDPEDDEIYKEQKGIRMGDDLGCPYHKYMMVSLLSSFLFIAAAVVLAWAGAIRFGMIALNLVWACFVLTILFGIWTVLDD